MLQIKNTGNFDALHVNVLVYGAAGVGKTRLISTLNGGTLTERSDVLIISAEAGLLSLVDSWIDYVTVSNMQELWEAYELAASGKYKSVAIDSISEIAEMVLFSEKKLTKDPRAAYFSLNERLVEIVRGFRDLPMDVYMAAKLEREQDESGRLIFGPSMPGKKLSADIVYQFDEVFCLRKETSPDGKTESMLMCSTDGVYQAKDRSGALETWEEPDLGAIIEKIKKRAKR